MPEAERAHECVTIVNREFKLGVVYAPCGRSNGVLCRKLIAFEPAEGWRGGKVIVQAVGRAARTHHHDPVSGQWWARWAGEPVGDEEKAANGARQSALDAAVSKLNSEPADDAPNSLDPFF